MPIVLNIYVYEYINKLRKYKEENLLLHSLPLPDGFYCRHGALLHAIQYNTNTGTVLVLVTRTRRGPSTPIKIRATNLQSIAMGVRARTSLTLFSSASYWYRYCMFDSQQA